MRHSSQLALFHHPVDGIQRPVDSSYHCCSVEKPSSAFWSVTACVTRSRLHNKNPICALNCIVNILERIDYLCQARGGSKFAFRIDPLLFMNSCRRYQAMSRIKYFETITCMRLKIDVQPCLRRVVRGADDLQRRRTFFDFPSEREINAYVVSIDGNCTSHLPDSDCCAETRTSRDCFCIEKKNPIVDIFVCQPAFDLLQDLRHGMMWRVWGW